MKDYKKRFVFIFQGFVLFLILLQMVNAHMIHVQFNVNCKNSRPWLTSFELYLHSEFYDECILSHPCYMSEINPKLSLDSMYLSYFGKRYSNLNILFGKYFDGAGLYISYVIINRERWDCFLHHQKRFCFVLVLVISRLCNVVFP